MCQVLKVFRSGYYAWRKRSKSKRQLANEQLLQEIRTSHEASRRLYGVRRIAADLQRRGIHCGLNRVHRLMKENGITSRRPRKFKATTYSKHNYPVADNLLNQNFKVSRPNQAWVADITYVYTAEGWLYLAAITDLYPTFRTPLKGVQLFLLPE